MNIIWVVAVALLDASGHVLVQRRPAGGSMAGLWEFPGGKIESGERPETALVRELEEELGIRVAEDDLGAATFASAPLGDDHLVILLYLCRTWASAPHPHYAEALRWVKIDDLKNLAMPPADVPLIKVLELLA